MRQEIKFKMGEVAQRIQYSVAMKAAVELLASTSRGTTSPEVLAKEVSLLTMALYAEMLSDLEKLWMGENNIK